MNNKEELKYWKYLLEKKTIQIYELEDQKREIIAIIEKLEREEKK